MALTYEDLGRRPARRVTRHRAIADGGYRKVDAREGRAHKLEDVARGVSAALVDRAAPTMVEQAGPSSADRGDARRE